MKNRKSFMLLLSMVSIICFSLQPINALAVGDSENSEDEETVTNGDSLEEPDVIEESDANEEALDEVKESSEEESESPQDTEITDEEEPVEQSTEEKAANEEEESKQQEEVTAEETEEPEVSTLTTNSVQNGYTVFKPGDRHEGIIELKVKLNAIGFDNISETDLYGSWTETRVKQFQDNYGLSATGVADEETQAKLDEVYYSPFQLGGSSEEIIDLKKKLNLMGFDGISLTINYGSWTETRVKQFQSFIGLKDNGIADAYTRQKLDEFLEVGYGVGDRHHSLVNMKRKLNTIGFDRISETDLFGSWTKTRIEQFQANYGLKVTGRANAETLSKLDEIVNNSFQVGDRDEAIIELKKKLNRMGFDRISETDLYGSWTKTRVEQFQEFIGLKPNGIADAYTIQKLDEFMDKGYKLGDRHDILVTVKNGLNKIGFSGIQETNYFGSWTETRVKQFQEYYGIEVTGTINAATLDKLDEVLNSPLQLNKRHDDLIQLKHKLNWLDYGYITVTDLYGSFTEKMVRKFQKDHGLPVSGIAEPNTIAKIDEVLETTFQPGQRHDGIVVLKKHLNSIGFGNISLTALYGDFTTKKVREFQEYYGLNVTGSADFATLEKILSIVDSPFQEGKRHNDTVTLKENLNQLGFGYITVSTLYGSFTVQQVKAFQEYYGLVVNGIADDRTIAKINELLESPFQVGKQHKDTATLKANLDRLGFGPLDSTSTYDASTAQAVTNFQKHYGLRVNGIADEVTLAKVNSILASPYQLGNRDNYIITIKEYLNYLGYNNIQVSDYFGDWTETRLKQFQRDYGLPVSGIADEITLAVLEEAASVKEIYMKTQYNITLDKALELQMALKNPAPQTDNSTGYISSKYLDVYSGGRITGIVVNLRLSPEIKNGNIFTSVEAGTQFVVLDDNVTGSMYDGSTRWIKGQYQGEVVYVHSSLAAVSGKVGITNGRVNVRAGQSTSTSIYQTVDPGTIFTVKEEGNLWHKVQLSYAWRDANPEDTKYYLDPTNFANDATQKYQFLDLRHFTGVPASELNELLVGAGVLEGKGEVFREAARIADINEIYLVSHALLETGRGKSPLSTGEIKHNGKPVYNFFGIGAFDGCAKDCGTQRAIAEEWFTVDDAIMGGAQFAGNSYIYAGQHTLYLMRWNTPSMDKNGRASHQYATDIAWASKQISNYKRIYDKGNYKLIFDIPVYK
ncbi:peptidoglycan-binding protein [Ornithinibacillus sp. JPR2-1]|uniref:peptidoglycan-binding protein n=1 Tax=Ornithinibacillus sp. JPR2-1 TaxID=2094019 RepID=UPI0031DE4734